MIGFIFRHSFAVTFNGRTERRQREREREREREKRNHHKISFVRFRGIAPKAIVVVAAEEREGGWSYPFIFE